jgi:hypothetical protein
LLSILLGRNGLVGRAGSEERPARNRVDRRCRTFEASRILAPAIGKCRIIAGESGKASENDTKHRMPTQADLLKSFHWLKVIVARYFDMEFMRSFY